MSCRDPLPAHRHDDYRAPRHCVRCPALWEPDDEVCAICGAEQCVEERSAVTRIHVSERVGA